MERLIFVHGYGGNAGSWKLVRDMLPDGVASDALDLVGFGDITPPAGFGYTLAEQASDLAARLKGFNRDYTLVAHSMGGAVAVIAMLDFGLLPARLILVDPMIFPKRIPFFIFVQTIPIISAALSWLVPASFQVDLVLRAVYYSLSKVNPEVRASYISAFKRSYHRFALRNTAVAIRNLSGSSYHTRLGELKARVEIIWGKQDTLLPFANAERLRQAIPNSTVNAIEACGHAPQEECPREFCAVLLERVGGIQR